MTDDWGDLFFSIKQYIRFPEKVLLWRQKVFVRLTLTYFDFDPAQYKSVTDHLKPLIYQGFVFVQHLLHKEFVKIFFNSAPICKIMLW
jgi:hypothetical protein